MYGIIVLQNDTHAKGIILCGNVDTNENLHIFVFPKFSTFLYFPSLAHICISLV